MYYLETNALRALGSTLGENKELLKKSYTSTFALFELIKGIDRSKDSNTRLKLLNSIQKTELKLIDFMPFEMIELAFGGTANVTESEAVKDRIREILLNSKVNKVEHNQIIERYESGTLAFQNSVTTTYSVPAPPEKKFRLDIEKAFQPERETLEHLKKIPKDSHPSRFFMEHIKQTYAPAIYRSHNPESKKSDSEILSIYNNSLDLYFLATFGYELKRKCLRQGASKNDLLDLFHALYLVDHDNIIVSNDAIFSAILPEINTLSVEEYRKLT
ncbi:hypothetical protein [Pseudomonas denitrificans (nom. rej.)]|uniref:Uncharacterized protein n=1 Tax=Pseudomonas denitrificans TaxID=43306 RepID=A0A9X7N132_PSEDE|nr:hypothetical protein [Pseudomonas denitrificans (nom. rej.)]QEY73081.1 hypothetical protein F1C79_16550 [Pseudomonas denitrificans (nom. rej.)]